MNAKHENIYFLGSKLQYLIYALQSVLVWEISCHCTSAGDVMCYSYNVCSLLVYTDSNCFKGTYNNKHLCIRVCCCNWKPGWLALKTGSLVLHKLFITSQQQVHYKLEISINKFYLYISLLICTFKFTLDLSPDSGENWTFSCTAWWT